MKSRTKLVVAGGLIAATLAVATPRAQAQTLALGWNASLSAACVTAACTEVIFTQYLTSVAPSTNSTTPVPAGISALNSPGYISFLDITSFGGLSFLSGYVMDAGMGWNTTVTEAGLVLQSNDTNGSPFSTAPLQVYATFGSSAATQTFASNGFAYLGSTRQCYNASGTVVSCTAAGERYQGGDFYAEATATPEPASLALMATGMIGLAGFIRRRKGQKSAE